MPTEWFDTAVSRQVWHTKYRFREKGEIHEQTIEDTWRRVARALASVEADNQRSWEARFYKELEAFKFIPGGRILAGAGTGRRVTLFNCFVLGCVEDSMDGIFDALKEGAITMQQGGGVGYDFSTLRPRGMAACGAGGTASGPVSFMSLWDRMCEILLSTSNRRGAMMATLRCDHPDIELFIDSKRDPLALRHFNLSVLVNDDFMDAVSHDAEWPLVFPVGAMDNKKDEDCTPTLYRSWLGSESPVPCRIIRVIRARKLWERLTRGAYSYAEPGVLFIDRINRLNNLYFRERISATNPCGEIPLPPYGACNLGSLNLTRYVENPFTADARIDLEGLALSTRTAVRMLDNVIDLSRYPFDAQQRQAKGSRRIGLGVTGLADMLIMLGLSYEQNAAREVAASVLRTICHSAYRTSVTLAREKGGFPFYRKDAFLAAPFIQSLLNNLRTEIAAHGLRNSHLIAIAPAGTISLLAGNVSSSIEPVFEFQHRRKLLAGDGTEHEYLLEDYVFRFWRSMYGDKPVPDYFVAARSLPPTAHLAMQAALQPYVDNSISKTINVHEDCDFESFKSIYDQAYTLGLKGCTTFRPNPVTGSVLTQVHEEQIGAHCCNLEREAD